MKKERAVTDHRRILLLMAAGLICLMLMGGSRVRADQTYGYLLPTSSYTYLDQSAVAGWPAQVVCYAKNEIYARNGRQFVSP